MKKQTLPTEHAMGRAERGLKNLSRPAAFLQVKHTIMNAKNPTDIKEAKKMIGRYILDVCEKPLREERMLDLQYILEWKISQMEESGITFEDPILNMHHKRLEAR